MRWQNSSQQIRENKIVVLSALSGTTNALVEIGQSAARFEREKAGELIRQTQQSL